MAGRGWPKAQSGSDDTAEGETEGNVQEIHPTPPPEKMEMDGSKKRKSEVRRPEWKPEKPLDTTRDKKKKCNGGYQILQGWWTLEREKQKHEGDKWKENRKGKAGRAKYPKECRKQAHSQENRYWENCQTKEEGNCQKDKWANTRQWRARNCWVDYQTNTANPKTRGAKSATR